MNELCLHRGAKAVSLLTVGMIDTPAPQGDHYPIAHTLLIDRTLESLAEHNYHVTFEQHALNRDGQQYFGLFSLKETTTDAALVVGLRNSHDMSMKAGLVLGRRVFVCDNLSFTGEVVFGRRHTKNIERDLTPIVHRAVGELQDLRQSEQSRITTYRQIEICGQRDKDWLLCQILRARILPSTKVLSAMSELKSPSFPEFKDYADTVYGVEMAITHLLKKSNPFLLPKKAIALHGILDSYCRQVGSSLPAENDELVQFDRAA